MIESVCLVISEGRFNCSTENSAGFMEAAILEMLSWPVICQ